MRACLVVLLFGVVACEALPKEKSDHDFTAGATAGRAKAAPTIPIIVVPGAFPH
jgi:hypothetical protein